MTGFLSLPPEVREMIYSYALVVGDVYPYRKTQQQQYNTSGLYGDRVQFTHPAVHLLSICRIIRHEAEPVLYSRNVVNLPVSILTQRFFDKALHTPERCSWVKEICVRFRSDDLVQAERQQILQPRVTSISTRLARGDTSDMLREVILCFGYDVHDALKKHLWESVWPLKDHPVLQHLKLDTMILDFYECFCTDRCCMLADYALAAFEPGFVHGAPQSVIIKDDEFNMLQTAAGHCGAAQYVEKLMGHWTAQRLQLPMCDEDMAAIMEIFDSGVKTKKQFRLDGRKSHSHDTDRCTCEL
jgi:hypothetical protein